MADREKLIELLETVVSPKEVLCDGEVLVSTAKVADHLIANGVTIQKWIPVTERLPDESIPSQHYLCWYKGRVRILKYWRTRKRFESNGRVANVTHWMPLPEPPKEGAEDG